MSVCDLAPAYIRALAPYQPGKPISELARECGLAESAIVKLASNENPLGLSEKAQAAIRAALPELHLYPDGNGFALKQAIAQKYGVDLAQIVLGNGSNDILEMVARVFLTPGTESLFSEYAFAVYPLATQAAGAQAIVVAAKNYGHDLPAMAAAITPNTRVIWVANPNNPTGTLASAVQMDAFLAAVPSDVLVVLDEAYVEYLPLNERFDSVAAVQRYPNLVVSRTLSKAYGLAGLRVGFALCASAVADLLNRVRQPFNVNQLALVAAEATLNDEAYLTRVAENNRAGMAQLTAGFAQLGLEWIPSAGNFVCVKVGEAAVIYQALLQRGVIVRPIAAYGLPEYLRVSIGLPAENATFLTALAAVLQAAE